MKKKPALPIDPNRIHELSAAIDEDHLKEIPDELNAVWDKEIAEAFKALRPQQQTFLIAYLNTGNSAESYRRAYNAAAKDHLAGNAGAQALESIGISTILMKFQQQRTHDLFLSVKTLREATKPNWVQDKSGQWENAGDSPDWASRKDAIAGLTKLRGLNAAEKKELSGPNGGPIDTVMRVEFVDPKPITLHISADPPASA